MKHTRPIQASLGDHPTDNLSRGTSTEEDEREGDGKRELSSRPRAMSQSVENGGSCGQANGCESKLKGCLRMWRPGARGRV
jgi:hypothetical protein